VPLFGFLFLGLDNKAPSGAAQYHFINVLIACDKKKTAMILAYCSQIEMRWTFFIMKCWSETSWSHIRYAARSTRLPHFTPYIHTQKWLSCL